MILLIDSYDSFTNNLAHLLKESTGQEVITIHNDSFTPNEYETFYSQYLPLFQFIVIGPGPGHPAIKSDIGIISWLIKKFQQQQQQDQKEGVDNVVVPILGICLGFQSLCYEFGNEVSRLQKVKHGQIYDIYPVSKNELFPDGESFGSVRYHSLFVEENINGEIIPLAYCYEPLGNDKGNNGDNKILMAMKHKKFPFYGVQYHPESICSSKGSDLIKNFSNIAKQYNETYRRNAFKQNKISNWLDNHAVHEDYLIKDGKFISNDLHNIHFEKLQLDKEILPIDVCDYFYHQKNNDNCDFILLNSASIPGEWSIIGLPTMGKSEIITHSVDDENHIYLSQFGSKTIEKQKLDDSQTVWNFIANRMQNAYISRETIKLRIGNDYGDRELPFWGGYMGLVSYEEGQHVIINKVSNICRSETTTPDLKMIFISRFIAFDHVTKNWFVVAINDSDNSSWGQEIIIDLHKVGKINLANIPDSVNKLAAEGDLDLIDFELPSRDIYKKQFNQCQEYLHSGDSYELCLTTQLKIHLPRYIKPWDIYKVLTLHKNPSPFSCFMDFDDCCLISSSPERFLSWKDDDTQGTGGGGNKIVQLRPIKGTVKNTDEVTHEMATKILKTPKEMGENLMIVDLIRHDLYQFTDDVEVSQLMAVEEYKTVFQLVSVIQGKLYKQGYHGIDLLHRSLPPGSMTGAPKKRSVELLQDIESMQKNFVGGRRGIYSGVVGYWSITDDSDWSVIIRSVFHYYNDKENNSTTKLWRIGAGGAITVLSDVDDEWEEMMLKLTSALQAFK